MELINKSILDQYPILEEEGDEKRLFEAIEKDNLIIFYGAGVSKLGGCSTWIELTQNVINEIPSSIFSKLQKSVLMEMSLTDPRKCISICNSILKDKNENLKKYFYEPIKKSVEPTNINNFVEIHDKMFQLKAKCYVTTNIDRGIEEVNDKLGLGGKRIFDLTNIEKDLDIKQFIRDGNIFYIHGQKDNIEDSIFTSSSYITFYQEKSIGEFLNVIFGNEFSVLFIGYSLNDYEILQNLFLSISQQKKIQYTHYILTPLFSRDFAKYEVEKEYFKIFSVKTLPYFIDYDGYEKLNEVLAKLSEIVVKRRIKFSDYEDKIKDIK